MIKLQRICTCNEIIEEKTVADDQDFDRPGIHLSKGWLIMRINNRKCPKCLEKLMNAS